MWERGVKKPVYKCGNAGYEHGNAGNERRGNKHGYPGLKTRGYKHRTPTGVLLCFVNYICYKHGKPWGNKRPGISRPRQGSCVCSPGFLTRGSRDRITGSRHGESRDRITGSRHGESRESRHGIAPRGITESRHGIASRAPRDRTHGIAFKKPEAPHYSNQ
jgi:hypothetical protein